MSLGFLLEILLGKDRKVTLQTDCIFPNIWTVASSQLSPLGLQGGQKYHHCRRWQGTGCILISCKVPCLVQSQDRRKFADSLVILVGAWWKPSLGKVTEGLLASCKMLNSFSKYAYLLKCPFSFLLIHYLEVDILLMFRGKEGGESGFRVSQRPTETRRQEEFTERIISN